MSKPGPKPRQGERYPSGKLKPTGSPPAQVQRILRLAYSRAADELLATQLGWLRLYNHLDDKQVAAGVMFAALVGQHDRYTGLPRRSAKTPSYQRGALGHDGDPHDTACECIACQRAVAVKRRHGAMIAVIPVGTMNILIAVCIEDRIPSWSERFILVSALDALVKHFQLTNRSRKK